MLETIRQFAEEQLAATGKSDEVRDRHAVYFAHQAVVHWEMWEGPGYSTAADWVDAELDNLRAGFRWAADNIQLANATAIAAHATTPALLLQLFEPIGWAEEILPAAAAADLPQLPRLYIAACFSRMSDTWTLPLLTLTRPWRWKPIPAMTRSTPAGAGTCRPAVI